MEEVIVGKDVEKTETGVSQITKDFNLSKMLKISIFVVLFILILVIIGIFIFSKTLNIRGVGQTGIIGDKFGVAKCLTEETREDYCQKLFLRKDISEICNDIEDTEIKESCFYEAAISNNNKEYCESTGELKETCIDDLAFFEDRGEERATGGEGGEEGGEEGLGELTSEESNQTYNESEDFFNESEILNESDFFGEQGEEEFLE